MTVFDELKARGLLAQLTDEEEIKELIYDLVKTYPDLKERIFGAMQRYPLEAWEPQGRYKRPVDDFRE